MGCTGCGPSTVDGDMVEDFHSWKHEHYDYDPEVGEVIFEPNAVERFGSERQWEIFVRRGPDGITHETFNDKGFYLGYVYTLRQEYKHLIPTFERPVWDGQFKVRPAVAPV